MKGPLTLYRLCASRCFVFDLGEELKSAGLSRRALGASASIGGPFCNQLTSISLSSSDSAIATTAGDAAADELYRPSSTKLAWEESGGLDEELQFGVKAGTDEDEDKGFGDLSRPRGSDTSVTADPAAESGRGALEPAADSGRADIARDEERAKPMFGGRGGKTTSAGIA